MFLHEDTKAKDVDFVGGGGRVRPCQEDGRKEDGGRKMKVKEGRNEGR